jgi:hypothetical protein
MKKKFEFNVPTIGEIVDGFLKDHIKAIRNLKLESIINGTDNSAEINNRIKQRNKVIENIKNGVYDI